MSLEIKLPAYIQRRGVNSQIDYYLKKLRKDGKNNGESIRYLQIAKRVLEVDPEKGNELYDNFGEWGLLAAENYAKRVVSIALTQLGVRRDKIGQLTDLLNSKPYEANRKVSVRMEREKGYSGRSYKGTSTKNHR